MRFLRYDSLIANLPRGCDGRTTSMTMSTGHPYSTTHVATRKIYIRPLSLSAAHAYNNITRMRIIIIVPAHCVLNLHCSDFLSRTTTVNTPTTNDKTVLVCCHNVILGSTTMDIHYYNIYLSACSLISTSTHNKPQLCEAQCCIMVSPEHTYPV